MSKHNTAYLGLGSNLGDSSKTIQNALQELSQQDGFSIVAVSKFYKTEPQDVTDQPWFINCVAKITLPPECSAEELLTILKSLEQKLGRKAGDRKKGPRMLDIDILFYNQEQHTSQHLTIPHPSMTKRAFVLVPLKEIAPDLSFPDGCTIDSYLNTLDYSVQGDAIYQAQS